MFKEWNDPPMPCALSSWQLHPGVRISPAEVLSGFSGNWAIYSTATAEFSVLSDVVSAVTAEFSAFCDMFCAATAEFSVL